MLCGLQRGRCHRGVWSDPPEHWTHIFAVADAVVSAHAAAVAEVAVAAEGREAAGSTATLAKCCTWTDRALQALLRLRCRLPHLHPPSLGTRSARWTGCRRTGLPSCHGRTTQRSPPEDS